MDEGKLDYLYNLNLIRRDDVDSNLADLIKFNYEFFSRYLRDLYHVEANFIYLNLVCGVNQTKIAEMVGVSQYGVCKRIKSGLSKIANLVMTPETDRGKVYGDLSLFLNDVQSEILFNYYFLKTFSLTGRVLNLDSGFVNSNVQGAVLKLKRLKDSNSLKEFLMVFVENKGLKIKSLLDLEKVDNALYLKFLEFRESPDGYLFYKLLAKRYYDYIKLILSVSSYGNYTFKKYDKQRKMKGGFK